MNKQKKLMLVLSIIMVAVVSWVFLPKLIKAYQGPPDYKSSSAYSIPLDPTVKDVYNKLVQLYYKPIWDMPHLNFVDWYNNPRFAVCDMQSSSPDDDLVLDKETGLVWTRDASYKESENTNNNRIWEQAVFTLRFVSIGNRMGWRLPAIEELSSLIDSSQSYPALPLGHPFINVQKESYWSYSTENLISKEIIDNAWCVNFWYGSVSRAILGKDQTNAIWPVRGGSGLTILTWSEDNY